MLDTAVSLFERAPARTSVPSILPLVVEGLRFERGGQTLIDGVDLTLTSGPRTVVLGPNGAGKSLLLRVLHGLIEPTAGNICWAGRPLDRDTRLQQAMVFQQPVLLRRSVAANVDYALRRDGRSRAERRLRTELWLARAGLSDLAGRPARVLSGGERQRLAVVRALSREPQILFLDEPTASLDPASVLAIETLIEAAHQAGTKIVWVTHDIGQARRLADEVLFLYRGRVEEFSSAANFFDHPRSDRARAFVEGRIVL